MPTVYFRDLSLCSSYCLYRAPLDFGCKRVKKHNCAIIDSHVTAKSGQFLVSVSVTDLNIPRTVLQPHSFQFQGARRVFLYEEQVIERSFIHL